MKNTLEKQLRALWKKVKSKDAPHPHMADDIEEFLDVGEWEIAFENILDWAAATKKLTAIKADAAAIRAEMKALSKK
jgi:hypothetical protein